MIFCWRCEMIPREGRPNQSLHLKDDLHNVLLSFRTLGSSVLHLSGSWSICPYSFIRIQIIVMPVHSGFHLNGVLLEFKKLSRRVMKMTRYILLTCTKWWPEKDSPECRQTEWSGRPLGPWSRPNGGRSSGKRGWHCRSALCCRCERLVDLAKKQERWYFRTSIIHACFRY